MVVASAWAVAAQAQELSKGHANGGAVKGKARDLRDKGIVAVNLGRYDDAVNLLEQAYEQSREPSILFDLVQAHRLNGNPERALILCASFLRTAPAINPRNREQVERTVAELGIIVEEIQLQGRRGGIARAMPGKTVVKDKAPGTTEPAMAAPAAAVEPEAVRPPEVPAAAPKEETKRDEKASLGPALASGAGGPSTAADRGADLLRVDARAADNRPARPFYRRPWFWTAAGVVAAGIVAVIVYEANKDPGPPRTSWGAQKVF